MTLHMLCGLAGSGKSTLTKKLHGYVVSTDGLRKCLWYDEGVTEHTELIFKVAYMITDYMLKYDDVILDTTNLTVKRRAKAIKIAKKRAVKVELHWVKSSPEVSIERNLKRERKVPVGAIRAMHKAFQEPTLEEGIDAIKIYGEDLNLIETISSP